MMRTKYPVQFNGKPLSHWQHEATKLVIDVLVRGAGCGNGENISIIGKIASKRLLELAQAEDAELFKDICRERDQSRANIALFVSSFTSHIKPKETPKAMDLRDAPMKMLRKFCIEAGYGVRYLSELKKVELMKVLDQHHPDAHKRFQEWHKRLIESEGS